MVIECSIATSLNIKRVNNVDPKIHHPFTFDSILSKHNVPLKMTEFSLVISS